MDTPRGRGLPRCSCPRPALPGSPQEISASLGINQPDQQNLGSHNQTPDLTVPPAIVITGIDSKT